MALRRITGVKKTVQAKLIIGLILFSTLAGLGWYAKAQTERAAVLASRVDAMAEAMAIQADSISEYEQTLIEREAARRSAAASAAEWQWRYEHDKKQPEVARWAAGAVPGPVYERVCEYVRCPDAGEAEADPPPD